eukprot:c19428_g1_i1.p1 GENE.c19428_g1_i1~~c19428_g1_i1.p1  ORF type:complete len:353 (+),score=83.94 c19428_g1_i1:21-1079(+)
MQSSSHLVQKAISDTEGYIEEFIVPCLKSAFGSSLLSADVVPYTRTATGKVRDMYYCDSIDLVVLVSTDRQSGFDRILASVPFKGQVLNLTSKWWFDASLKELGIPNAIVATPDPNVTVAKICQPFPIEFVMRAYLTGSTNTSILHHYEAGSRSYCGHTLPDGMVKNQQLERALLTPTTKDDKHDELISAEEIQSRGLMSAADWDTCQRYAHQLFAFGQRVAASRGLILVDTKYEFGKDGSGQVVLIDEVHTPDSSRYWVKDSYEERFQQGANPENIDKEFLRLWFRDNCDPYHDEVLPEAPASLVSELSRRYIMLYEIITGSKFEFPNTNGSATVADRVKTNIEAYFATLK